MCGGTKMEGRGDIVLAQVANVFVPTISVSVFVFGWVPWFLFPGNWPRRQQSINN